MSVRLAGSRRVTGNTLRGSGAWFTAAAPPSVITPPVPSAISSGARGSRPASTGGTAWPLTACMATTVTSSRPSSSASPMAVTVIPETNGSARSRGTACALVSPECGLPTVTSQFQPVTAGSATTCDRLSPNTSAASTAATAAVIPTIA
ncbi:MAG TPA: hypothetical protein VF223_16985, partial [Trebonia sp.]